MKDEKQILDEIRRLKTERKKLFIEYVNVYDVNPRIAVIGCSKHTTEIKKLRWVLK